MVMAWFSLYALTIISLSGCLGFHLNRLTGNDFDQMWKGSSALTWFSCEISIVSMSWQNTDRVMFSLKSSFAAPEVSEWYFGLSSDVPSWNTPGYSKNCLCSILKWRVSSRIPPLRNMNICSPWLSALDVTDHSFNPIFEEVGSLGDIGIECLITLKLETISVVVFCESYSDF